MAELGLQSLLKAVAQKDASDLHIVAGSPPAMRLYGRIMRVKAPEMTPEQTQKYCYSVLTESQKSRFEEKKELDFSFWVADICRFRGNLFMQKGAVSGVFRRIPEQIPDWQELGIPKSISDLTTAKNGLILVTGPTGSGKTTTIASLIDKINQEAMGHIITLEDPIEFIHKHKNCIVNQREVGSDSNSFSTALRHILRQDPDFCLMGEMRDLETIETALQVAETGHLVMATLHTNSAIQTLDRIVGVFPPEQQDRIRLQLSSVLQGIVSQQLIPSRDGKQLAAFEILLFSLGVRNLIRENKFHQIYSMMQLGQEKTGMRTMNQSLMGLVMRRRIDLKVAFENSPDPDELDSLLKKAGY